MRMRPCGVLRLAALCVLHVAAPRLVAATYHVNAATGDDRHPGTAPDQAFKTISRAARVAKPGDTVLVGPGTYDEQVGIGGHPEAGERTVFRAEPLGKAILDGEEKQFRFSIRRPKVSVVGFECRRSREHALDFGEPAHDGIVSRCVLVDNKLDGIFFRGCKGARVVATVCARNGRNGVWFLQSTGGLVVNATLVHNRASGLSAQDTPNLVAFNNIIAHNGAGIRMSGSTAGALRSDHNLLEGGFLGEVHGPDWLFGARTGTLHDWQELSGQDAHSLQADPLIARDAVTPDASHATRSPAFRQGLRVERFEGIDAPADDVFGITASPNVAPGVGAAWEPERGAADPFTVVDVPFDGSVSAAIVDAKGQIVRTLLRAYPAAKGKLPLHWDGKNELGTPAPAGEYRWQAIVHNVRGVDDGSVGDTGQPPYGRTQVSDGVCDLACDARGDLYEMSFWDESGHCLRKLRADGSADWVIPFYIRNTAGGLGTAVATDGTYVFGSLVRQRHEKRGRIVRDDIRRLFAADGKPANFPAADGQKPHNLIQVNPEKPEPWIHAQRHSKTQARKLFGIRGLAIDAARLYVSNTWRDRIDVYDKETGKKLTDFAVPMPLGIAAAPDGTLWVANSGDRVTQFTAEGKPKAKIPGLKDPYAVTFGGPKQHLYLTELDAGHIREYAVDGGQPRLVHTLGRPAGGPGPVEPDAFRWGDYSGIAVDAQGRVTVTDKGNHRVQRFHPDGSPWQSLFSDFVSAPFVDLRQPDVLISGTRQYRVDYTTGKWAFTHNWKPADGRFGTHMVLRRPLPNGRDYLFHLGGHRLGVVIYAIEGDALRRSAMLGGRWMGTDDLGKGDGGGMYTWTDANADGTVEDAEMTWTQKPKPGGYPYSALAPGWWVDERGDLWLADQVTRGILRLKLLGFDPRGNPRYDWATRQAIVPRDPKPWAFVPKNLRVAPDGDVYAQGTIESNRDLGPFWMGGTAVARYAPDGTRRWILPLPRVAVALSTDGQFWYVGEGPTAKVSMYTADGLFVCAMAPGKPSGYQTGWIDHAMGIFAFRHPATKTHYVYAEEDLFGKSIRYRIEGLAGLTRLDGTLAWKAPADAK